MRQSIKHTFVFLFIALLVSSSCAVRKGIQSFFSNVVKESTAGKIVKKPFVKEKVSSESFSCNTYNPGFGGSEFLHKQTANPTTVNLLFFILPGFLISILVCGKEHAVFPVTDPRFRWPSIPLFLKNRLLLI